MLHGKRIYVAGHRGLIGSAIAANLKARGCSDLITAARDQLDLLDRPAVDRFMQMQKPDVIFICAAKVGGIHANNTYRADFIYQNLQIQNNLIWSAHQHDVANVIFLGSSCIYPSNCPQPMKEDYFLSGELEFTNRPYAVAKIAGMELINALCQQYGREYFSVMPTNLYGPRDSFHPDNSHVIAALLQRFYKAKLDGASEVVLWGTGKPFREFMYAEDCADAIVHLANCVDSGFFEAIKRTKQQFFHINVGTGQEVSIAELARLVAEVVGFKGRLVQDTTKPDGVQRKLLDSSKLFSFGWAPKTKLKEGLEKTFSWYIESLSRDKNQIL